MAVHGHLLKALEANDNSSNGLKLGDERRLALRLSALLHDADDKKYFKTHTTKENATRIVATATAGSDFDCKRITNEVMEMIGYVSFSDNGNSIPPRAAKSPEFLWPRYSDRLEAIGPIGAVRCYQYNEEVKRPKFIESTPQPKTREELWSFVTPERLTGYMTRKDSESMMDHYFDKLLQIAAFDPSVVRNNYLTEQQRERVEPLVKICLQWGKTGKVPEKLIKSYDTDASNSADKKLTGEKKEKSVSNSKPAIT